MHREAELRDASRRAFKEVNTDGCSQAATRALNRVVDTEHHRKTTVNKLPAALVKRVR